MKCVVLILLASLSFISLTACQSKKSFTPLHQSASNITLTRYDGNYKNPETVILTGAKKNQLLSILNKDGKHIIPDGVIFNCPSATIQNTVYRDIIVHYNNSNPDRLFELNTLGCTSLIDVKDGISLEKFPDLSQYFK